MINNQQEKHNFKSETKQLLHLMIHSLYSNKEIFLRELISNASDAIDKMRFIMLTKDITQKKCSNMYIKIIIEKNKKTITISDNGIGMTKNEVIKNLGMIANSGTKKFLKNMSTQDAKNSELIGKFGVGFYSAFIVAKKVVVKTKHMNNKDSDLGIMWESEGKGEYFVKNIHKKENGTEIILYLKDKETKFLEYQRIKNIIQKYSDHISIPIKIQKFNKDNKILSWKQINQGQALWTRNKNSIKIHEYEDFYKNLTKDPEKPLTWIHSSVEGIHEYTCILYIPKKSTYNIIDQDNKKSGLKLYIKKIYIMDDANQFLPSYLRFIKGIVDTNNLPLNVSREILQNNKNVNILKNLLTKRVLKLIQEISLHDQEKYTIFWKEFGSILKEGIAEDIKNQEIIASLLRFTSMNNNSKKQTISLEKYIKNMPSEQNKIYFITAENYDIANTSPHLEIFRKNNIDVLLLSERIDDWMMHYLTTFKNKKFQSICTIDQDSEKFLNKNNQDFEITLEMQKFLDKIQEVLKKDILSVKLSTKLIDSPAVLITSENAISPQMSKIFIAAGQKIPPIKYIFEINPKHPIIKKMITMHDLKNINIWIQTLFDQALLSIQGTLKNPNNFIKNINQLLIEK